MDLNIGKTNIFFCNYISNKILKLLEQIRARKETK